MSTVSSAESPLGAPQSSASRFTILFVFFTVFLGALGMTIIIPVLPFVV